MKNPSDLTEAEERDSSAAQPFNLFAGINEEQLPTSAVQTGLPPKESPKQEEKPLVEGVVVGSNRTGYWIAGAIAVLVILFLVLL